MFKNIVVLVNLIFLVSCSSFPSNNIAPGYLETFNSIKNAVMGYESEFINRELIDNIPYASLTLKIGKGPKGLLILESIKNDQYYWISADSIYLVTKGGRIIKTEGLDNDLKEIIYPRISFQSILSGELNHFKAYYSFSNPELNNLELQFKYTLKGEDQVKILDEYMDLILVHEQVSSDQLGWKFTNKYWLDKDYYVWKSLQYLTPLLPGFNIEITKKPSS